MYYRLQRQNSFGPYETKSTLVISRTMELKILDGESSIPNASPVVLENINKSLECLINSHDRTKTVVHELPDFVKNTIISHCDLSEKELIDKRYGEYFEGYSLANNVQYIPVEIECLSNLDPDLCKSILALFVSVVFEYITEDKNSNVFELIKWGSGFLQRIGKMLNLNDNEVLTIIRPVSESLELKQLGMNFDDLRVEKQIHVSYILEQLEPMQENIDEFFKQTMGTFDDDNDFDYNEDDFNNDENLFKTELEEPFKLPENFEKKEVSSKYEVDNVVDKDTQLEHHHVDKEKEKEDKELKGLKKKEKKQLSKELKESKKKEKKESSKKLKKKEKEDRYEEDEDVVDKELENMEKYDIFEQYNPLHYDKMHTDSIDNQEFYEVEMGPEDEDEEEVYFKKNFVDNYKPKKKKSKEQFDIKDLMSLLDPDIEDDVLEMEERVEIEHKEDLDEEDLSKFESLDSIEQENMLDGAEHEQVEVMQDKHVERNEEYVHVEYDEKYEEVEDEEMEEKVEYVGDKMVEIEQESDYTQIEDTQAELLEDVGYEEQVEQEDYDSLDKLEVDKTDEQVEVVEALYKDDNLAERIEYELDKLEVEKTDEQNVVAEYIEHVDEELDVQYSDIEDIVVDEEVEVMQDKHVERDEEYVHVEYDNKVDEELDVQHGEYKQEDNQDLESVNCYHDTNDSSYSDVTNETTQELQDNEELDKEEQLEHDSISSKVEDTSEHMESKNSCDLVQQEYEDTGYPVIVTPRNTLVQQEDMVEVVEDKEDMVEGVEIEQVKEVDENEEVEHVERVLDEDIQHVEYDNKLDEQNQADKDEEVLEVEQEYQDEQLEHPDNDSLVMDLSDLKIEEPKLDRHMSDSGLTESSNTNMGDVEEEEEEEDLLKILERSLKHKSSLPTNDYDNLLNDISNLNLPPKKNKSLTSKIFSNISKRINRVFSIASEKSSKMTYTSSLQSGVNFYPNQDYLNNLLLIEKSPYIVAVLVRNLVLKYIISGYNDSRVQVVFERFSNLLGVSSSSVLSIENNIVSDLAGILDVSAAKTTSKKMSKRLKILSATVGGTALLALTAGVASPVLAVGVAFLGLGGTGVSTYLNSNEGSNILKNIFGLNVSLTHFKVKREHLTNLQFIQLNPKSNIYRDSIREPESNRFSTGRDSIKSDSTREKEDLNNNFIGICICVGNNVFLNEMFFFENESIDFKSVETIRHLDSEYIDIWKRQFPVPISDLYLLKWESKLMASLHRMLLKLNSLSIYQKSLELYQITHNTEFTSKRLPKNYDHYYSKQEPDNLLMFDDVRDSSGGSRYTNLEGSSGTSDFHCSKTNKETNNEKNENEEKEDKTTEPIKDFYKDFKDVRINWPVGLIQLCSNLDNCWLVCRNRAETCGMLLANAICDKLLTGDRHISLVGYSMGARVIFYCLLTLFQRNKLHVVKDVVLMGLPSTAGYNEWTKCTCVVAGRIINVYNENDWVLAFLYRYTANYRVAGLAPVIHERVENYNVTNLFSSHVDYLENISKITAFLNIHI